MLCVYDLSYIKYVRVCVFKIYKICACVCLKYVLYKICACDYVNISFPFTSFPILLSPSFS